MNSKSIMTAAVTALLMMSCGSGKMVTKDGKAVPEKHVKAHDNTLAFLQKVSDNAVYQKNIVSRMTFTLSTGSKEISVPGSIHMRKDDVIRLQLFVPLLGSEVGRLEFTKDYVLIVDRLHKQYIKEDYNRVDFLRDKGLNFYTLQSLFWNQLFIPGTQKVGEQQLEEFSADLNTGAAGVPVSLKQGKMEFVWTADKESGQINEADITYKSGNTGTSSLKWSYSGFRAFGSKKYPYTQSLNLKTDAVKQKKEVKVVFEMSGVSADSDWESRTKVSDKYTKVDAMDILKQLINF